MTVLYMHPETGFMSRPLISSTPTKDNLKRQCETALSTAKMDPPNM